MIFGRLRILVTAVGGDFGQALVKALRLGERPMQLHGSDTAANGIGAAFVESYHVVPAAHDGERYLEALDSLCKAARIDVVIPASEAEIKALSQSAGFPRLPSGATIVCQPGEWIDIYGDKLSCMRALEGKVELAPFADSTDAAAVNLLIEAVGYPVVVKPRRSSGSRNLRVVSDAHALKHALQEVSDAVVQQHVPAAGGEYSIGVFACDQFTALIAFRRELNIVGCSWYAENSDDAAVLDYARSVAAASRLNGAANVQVRKAPEGVRLLEINPRFSSLVAARALCGFRDVEWSVSLALGEQPLAPPESYRRIRFRRFFGEMIDLGEGFQAISEWTPQQLSLSKSEAAR
jgi:carbamoyl-phosphate synthase large subunit